MNQPSSTDQLHALQHDRLRWSLMHAYEHVPHYKRAFDAQGVHPGEFQHASDLARFPLLTKENLRQGYPFGMLAVPRSQLRRVHASSGTTGQPTVVAYTAQDVDVWADLVARCIRAAGGRAGDMVHVAYGYGLFTGGLGAHHGAERAGCTVVPMSGGQTEKQIRLIHDLQPDIIMVTPSYMQVLIEASRCQGLDLRKGSLRIGMLGAEPWSEAMRDHIEEGTGMQAFDIYGLSEMMGPGVACEGIASKGALTIWEDHFYPEIIDPETGQVLPDGQWGELVLTSLSKEALPMVRYRTRDISCLLPAEAPLPFRRLARMLGRSDDMLIIRGVNVYPSQIEEIILRHPQLSGQYELVVQREGLLDEMCVRCELRHGETAANQRAIDEVGTWVRHQVKSTIGVTVNVQLMAAQAMPRIEGGKSRRVQDLRRLALTP